jgi:hypothetical protein
MEKRISGSLAEGKSGFSWKALSTPAKAGVIGIAVLVGLFFALRILPILVAAMGLGLLVAILFIPYWIPTIVAFMRKHPSKGAILVLNMFFGWTFVGWLISLVWALGFASSNVTQQTVVVHTTNVMSGPDPNSLPPRAQVGDVIDGRRFNGTSWVPLQSPAPAPLTAQVYRAGDVVDGQRFDGQSWTPVQPTLPIQAPPPEQLPG